MKALRHPATRFVLAGLLLLVVVVTITSAIADLAAEKEALAEARTTTGILATGVAEPALRGLASLGGDAGGRLDLRSDPGRGTTVRVNVPW